VVIILTGFTRFASLPFASQEEARLISMLWA